ncbi:MAG: hypothetical protein A2X08_04820 [Bacteroidetes bacterium GWA2_32_17]|nr:MAG: hypothetical protein A2X08_04820 [Bacteroidetes bacterium GWA2_32_17]
MENLNFTIFEQLLKIAKNQFEVKTISEVVFINVQNFSSFIDEGFIARNYKNNKFDVVPFEEVLEITIDNKKFKFKGN